jgi:hypothetical protein
MNTTITHWLAAANGSTDRACGEKPPVGSVANACAAAWYGVIRESTPVQPKIERMRIISAVRPT